MEDSRKLSRAKKVITISPSFTSYRRENGYPGDMRHSGACCRGAGNAWLLRATAFLALLEKTAIKGPLTPRRPGAMTDGTFSKTLVFHCDPGCKSQAEDCPVVAGKGPRASTGALYRSNRCV